ncbi:replication restart helicase PriA [Pseudodesulfovibrio senegalensis]|uniref:Replication restart protein PriA n=1 Tax=Pseudodesulfovibrio senegalensis TaxID=1721087 RepID=A0A6N6N5L3_9BACT|nr:primosomal protein N' [Pseudodesulfovibrio senegalensis]KAB1443472.1 primosomal protein N' [Pseudodesulfovibrio senegalensis]
MKEFWHVILASPPYQSLTYGLPDYFPDPLPGMRVLVPLGRGHRVGIVSGAASAAPAGVRVKPMLWPLEHKPVLDDHYMSLVRTLAARNMEPEGRVLENLLPHGMRKASVSLHVERDSASSPFPATLKPPALAAMDESARQQLMDLWHSGKMRARFNIKKDEQERFVRLLVDPPWPVRPNARRQINLLEHLFDKGPQSLHALKYSLGNWAADTALRLETAGLLNVGALTSDMIDLVDSVQCEAEAPDFTHELTREQQGAFETLSTALNTGQAATHLVHGVTGSGKTYLYLRLAAQCLEAGRSVMLLAPEVALACQLAKAAAAAFPGRKIYFHHGYQSPRKRESTFMELADSDQAAVVVGTRSSLFLPVRNVGLVVLDEEHDESYKQEERMPYQAKEVAWFRARLWGALMILGSATPDVKTYHAAKQGGVPVSVLRDRIGTSVLPEVSLVAMDGKKDREQPFAPQTVQALQRVVEAGEQAIVMLNRRGYAPLMYCVDCAQVVRCPDCEVGMTFHKGRERVVCHYCGRHQSYPLLCSKCGGGNFIPMGEGTERLEEQLEAMLPDGTGILRLDRDSTRRQERMEEILDEFGRGEAQILVGTQMLSKGHHFPGVTLVVVTDGDLGLNLPDYRASERTFQLLVQVAGRAGRGTRSGKVLIQTRNPGHPIWQEVLAADYEGFFAREIEKRRSFGYPPFSKLGLIRMSFPADWEQGARTVMEFSAHLRTLAARLDVVVLGPAPAPLAMLRGRRRFNCLLKAGDWPAVRQLFAALRDANPATAKIRMSLDLDPVSML